MQSDFLKELSQCTQAQLLDIKIRVDYLLSNSKKKQDSKIDSLFYDSISKQFKDCSGLETLPFFKFKQTKYFKKLIETQKYLDKYIQDMITKPSKREKVQFYMLFTKIMYDYLEHYNLPKDISVILNSYTRYSSLLEQAFPGYLLSGVQSFIFRKKK